MIDNPGSCPRPGGSEIPQTGADSVFGRTCFLLPNSMYGAWTTRVTRSADGANGLANGT